MPALKNQKHEAFAQALAKGANQSDAYAQAGYKPCRQSASRLMTKADIAMRVKELQSAVVERFIVEEARVLQEAARIALADPRRCFDESGDLLPPKMWPDEVAATISSVEIDDRYDGAGDKRTHYRVKKVRFWDKNSAIEKLMKHLGSFEKDNLQRAGALADLPRDELKMIEDKLRALISARMAGGPVSPGSGRTTH
jgi:phage terminase small subunit